MKKKTKEALEKLRNTGEVIINDNGTSERHLPLGFKLSPNIEEKVKENRYLCKDLKDVTSMYENGKFKLIPKKGAVPFCYTLAKSEHIIGKFTKKYNKIGGKKYNDVTINEQGHEN